MSSITTTLRAILVWGIVAVCATPAAVHADVPLPPLLEAAAEHHEAHRAHLAELIERGLHPDEVPVALFVAEHAHRPLSVVVDLRLGGREWPQIAADLDLGADLFFVELPRDPGPPYGKAWGYFKKRRREQWRVTDLDQRDIIDLVNLRLIVEWTGRPADEVARLRSKGLDFDGVFVKLAGKAGKAGGPPGQRGHGHDKAKKNKKKKPKGKPDRPD